MNSDLIDMSKRFGEIPTYIYAITDSSVRVKYKSIYEKDTWITDTFTFFPEIVGGITQGNKLVTLTDEQHLIIYSFEKSLSAIIPQNPLPERIYDSGELKDVRNDPVINDSGTKIFYLTRKGPRLYDIGDSVSRQNGTFQQKRIVYEFDPIFVDPEKTYNYFFLSDTTLLIETNGYIGVYDTQRIKRTLSFNGRSASRIGNNTFVYYDTDDKLVFIVEIFNSDKKHVDRGQYFSIDITVISGTEDFAGIEVFPFGTSYLIKCNNKNASMYKEWDGKQVKTYKSSLIPHLTDSKTWKITPFEKQIVSESKEGKEILSLLLKISSDLSNIIFRYTVY